LAWVSKWHSIYTAEGAAGLRLRYQGSPGYLTELERKAIVAWIAQHPTLTVEAVRDYVEAQYGITYQSKQSYYDLLSAGGLSHHQSEALNPKRDETQVQAQREAIKKNWQAIKSKSSKAS
jgi:putative transposase